MSIKKEIFYALIGKFLLLSLLWYVCFSHPMEKVTSPLLDMVKKTNEGIYVK